MPKPNAAQSGNLKLRGLLQTSRELLRRRQLKKALNNAQIAQDFAIRSGEAPGIAAAAQLLMAEIYLLNAAYTYDAGLRSQGWQLLEQLEANKVRGVDAIAPAKITYVKAVALLRLGELDSAQLHLEQLLEEVDENDRLYARSLVAYASTLAQRGDVSSTAVLAKAETALANLDDLSSLALAAELALAKAHAASDAADLSRAIDEAHQAKQYAQRAQQPETEAQANIFLGKLSRLRGNHQIALRFLYEALDAGEQIDCKPLLVDAHLEIGHVFVSLSNDLEADKYFRYVAEETLRADDSLKLYEACLALGCHAHRRGDFADANASFGRALQAAKDQGNTSRQALVLGELAALKLDEGFSDLAAHLSNEACRQFAEIDVAASAKTQLIQLRLQLADAATADAPAILTTAASALARAREERKGALVVEALRLQAQAHQLAGDLAAALESEQQASTLAVRMLQRQRERHLPDLDMRAALRQKEREIEKLTQQNDLKNAIVAKNEEIERANQDLVQANEELRQFAYVASHDLKEPLRQIGSYVSLIKRNYYDLLDERGETFFGFVTEGVGRLNRLLDSLMHYTSVARIDNEVSDVDLNHLIKSIENELSTTIEQSGAKVKYNQLPKIQTGGKLLRHVVYSLIDNALKFHSPQRAPEVHIWVDVIDGMYRIGVQDNGIGIDPSYQDKVFVLFQMLHAKSAYVGTGVGLAIAQKTIQRLGGRIWFEPNQHALPGTTFYITLPMSVERQLPGPSTVTEQAA